MDLSPEKKYITAKEASALTGFVADYITRQCREGKIASRQIGRVWLIEEESLLAHFASEARRKEENAKALAREREREYAEARKKREDAEPTYEAPIESPFAPTLAHPPWFSDETSVPALRGSFVALAITLSILSAGLYAGLPETQRVAMASVYRVGGFVVGAAKEVVYVARNINESTQEEVFVVSERETISQDRKPSLLVLPPVNEVMAMLSVPEISAPQLVAYQSPREGIFSPLAHMAVDLFAGAQYIPRTVVSGVYTLGYQLASRGNEAPHKTVAFVQSFEGEALGVIGNVALAYDTAKETVSRAYDYAPRTHLAAVSEARVTTSNAEHTSVLERVVLFTHQTVNKVVSFVGSSFASLSASKEEDDTEYVVEPMQEEVGRVAQVVVPSVAPQNPVVNTGHDYSTPIYNEYYTITSTGVSKEYVDTEIRRHIENLDDRIDDRLDGVGGGGGGGGGSGSVTSVDMSGGTTGLSFSGGPITSSGSFTLSGTLAIANGGTGITTAPSYGQLLMGNGSGGYSLVATSSLGLAGVGGTPSGSDGEIQFNQGGAFGAESAFSYASTTNTLSVTSGVIQSTSGIFRGDDEYHQIIFHNVGNSTDYFEWGDTLANSGGHRFYTGGPGFTLRAQIADNGSYFSGNVAIGTTSLSSVSGGRAIHIGGSDVPELRLSSNSDLSSGFALQNYQRTVNLANTENGPMVFMTNNTERMRILAGGNVGIGTTSPYAKLSVVGPVVAEYFHATSSTATSIVSGTLRLPLLGTPAGSFIAVNGSGDIIATTTPGGASYTFAYPLQNSANTISLGFGTTTSNTWSGTQTFSYASSTGISSLYASSTSGFLGTLAIGGPSTTNFITEFGSRTFSNYTDSTGTNGYAFVLGRGADADNTSAPNFYFTRNNGSSASIVDGNYIGRLSALPWDGDEGVFSSAINFRVNGTVADNSIPTDITFETGTRNSTLAERMRITSGGNVGVGTTSPWRRLSVTDTSAQFVTGYDSTRYTQFSTDSVGDLTLDPQGGDIFALDENLYICAGGACPSGTPSAAGTIVAETAIGVASSTPWAGLSLASGKALIVAENTLATSTSMTIDWRNGNQQLVRLGTSATTISFSGYVEGQKLTLMVCNPGSTAGAVSWGTQILWSGGSAPTQTTTANKCDAWSFLATQATSTMKIFGSQSANF